VGRGVERGGGRLVWGFSGEECWREEGKCGGDHGDWEVRK
jgi:hypothetical protein